MKKESPLKHTASHRCTDCCLQPPGGRAASLGCPSLLGWGKLFNTPAASPVTHRSPETPSQSHRSHTRCPATLLGPWFSIQQPGAGFLCKGREGRYPGGCGAENHCWEHPFPCTGLLITAAVTLQWAPGVCQPSSPGFMESISWKTHK